MHGVCIHTLYLCVFHRWMALQRERVLLACQPCISASSAPARDCMRTQEHTCPHLCAHTRTRIGGPAAHNGPRRTDDPPSTSRLRWRAARAGNAAHTWDNEVTAAVFHAPMFALNADAEENACEPSHTRSTPTEGARMCRSGCVGPQSYTHMHTRTDAARGRVYAACPHRRSVCRCS